MTHDNDIFGGDLHGFLIYPASWAKGEKDAFTPLRTLKHIHAQDHGVKLGGPVQMQLPKPFGGAIFSSSYDKPDPLIHEQAVAKLYDQPHADFLKMADDATRRYLKLPHDVDDHFTHLHGIGSWENNVEPSMMTVFHRPVEGLQLQRIGADIGAWARQHGILAFSPHPAGGEHLLHMRLRTHPEMPRLTRPVVANISQRIHDEFNKYFDPNENGGQSFWIPGRTILPDRSGHTDVLTWIPPWEGNPDRVHKAFAAIANKLGAVRSPTFWPGTGLLLGGTSPYSDEETAFLSDAQKRDAAVNNYRQAIANPEAMVHATVPTAAEAFVGNPAARRMGKRVVGLRDFMGRYKQRLSRNVPAIQLSNPEFRAAIDSSREDKAPRLVYADYLDEAGHSGLATAYRKSTEPVFGNGYGDSISHITGTHPSGGYVSVTLKNTKTYGNPEANVAEVYDLTPGGVPFYRTDDMDHVRQLVSELHPYGGVGSGRLEAHNHARDLLQLPHYDTPKQLARSPAKTGAVVRGIYYEPGKMMPDVVPVQAGAAPDQPQVQPRESTLARIRRKFKKNTHNVALTGVNRAGNAAAGVGNNGYSAGAAGSGGGAGGSAGG